MLTFVVIFSLVAGCNDIQSRKNRFFRNNEIYVSGNYRFDYRKPFIEKISLDEEKGEFRYVYKIEEIGECIYYYDVIDHKIVNWGVVKGQEFCLNSKINYGAQ